MRMMKLASWIPWTRKSFRQNLNERYENLSPHEQLLLLSLPDGAAKPKADAIASKLMKFAERPTPFVAILIDFGGIEYVLSSADLASIAATIAAWVRGWVAPCAIVMTGSSADMLRKVLEITKLNQIDQLRVVDTKESGLNHIRTELEQVRKHQPD
jgi:hypothetical protein